MHTEPVYSTGVHKISLQASKQYRCTQNQFPEPVYSTHEPVYSIGVHKNSLLQLLYIRNNKIITFQFVFEISILIIAKLVVL